MTSNGRHKWLLAANAFQHLQLIVCHEITLELEIGFEKLDSISFRFHQIRIETGGAKQHRLIISISKRNSNIIRLYFSVAERENCNT